ncbi:alpha/beta hydrolase [Chryseobacterium sp. D764]|jgi:proline iminopeptidase|uniref:alpha/beta hydrolase n=1 Tax=unclassified Chryseobacterium TaxID=2593645 RepID=UPI000985EB4C|nr:MULTISPECIES: alpha/beta hydrolase [unclassified Chryseobacterium]QXU51039.1 alpha/beta hydrolase [Chryseobacterium sp. D764]CAD0220255.1 Alpha/beta hydrolase [Chryseobacterium sp. JV274]
MKSLFSIIFIVCSIVLNAQNLYSKAYGNPKNIPVIFIHGGPSGNATLFEGTTAQKLADKGFYVIVYDRRGEGRSKDENATMTFKESFEDLKGIYTAYHIKKANILAHSFGGIIGTLFTSQFPEKVNSLTLAGALFTQQETYDHILKQAKEHFKNDSVQLKEISEIENLDKNSAAYRKRCYEMAGKLSFFDMPNPTPKSEMLRNEYKAGEFYKNNIRNPDSPLKFYKNETLNNLDNTPVLKDIRKKGIPIFAVYGKDDGIFSEKQLNDLKNIVGVKNFRLIDNCSHYLFVDQQEDFLQFIKLTLK